MWSVGSPRSVTLDCGAAGAAAQGLFKLEPAKEYLTMNSDSKLQSDVQTELKWKPSVSAAHIGVAAKNGVVTLTGQVAHFTEKTAAEDAAKGVYGVKGVANDITVEL